MEKKNFTVLIILIALLAVSILLMSVSLLLSERVFGQVSSYIAIACVVVTLIESIIVYSKESVTVIFHHQDEIQEMTALAGVTAIDRKKAAL